MFVVRLVLVFAADLKQVEEVGGASADGDEVLIGGGSGVGNGSDGEVAGPLLGCLLVG